MKGLLFALTLGLVPSSALAFGADITWNDCVNGTALTASLNKVFDCAITGNRNYNLEFQYKCPVTLPNLVAVTVYADLGPNGAPLSPFWHYENGGCNQGAVKGAQMIGVIPTSCADAGYLETWDGGPSGTFAIAAYLADFQSTPGRGRFVLLGARGDGFPVNAGDNMWAFELRFNNRNRPGSAANCAGCSEQKFLGLERTRLESNDGSPAVDLVGADKLSDCVTINNAPPGCFRDTPAQNTTWGRIKSIFR
jgi:hypothetical protein